MGTARAKGKSDAVNLPAASGRPPRLPETLVARERLYAVLDRTSASPLSLLVAPAGTGKTILLSAWAERHIDGGDKVIWIATHDHHLLKSRLCEAVGKKPGPILEVLEAASAGGVVPTVVVVDDAHLLEREQLQLLEEILSSVPDAVRLVLASRRDLALPVLELDLTGRASTLRSRDLRFNDQEATDLVLAHAELATADDITQLRERTAGWAAALVLAARSLASTPGAGILSPALVTTDQPVLDLLLGEAFTTLSEPARQMLLSTFGEPFTTASRASLLSGNPDAGNLLTDLTSSGLLVTAYSAGDGIIYRYHPLLVELLRRRVVSQPSDAGVVRLAHLRAAEHEESLGHHAAALSSAIEARDSGLITRLLVEYGPEMLSNGEHAAVGSGFDALPTGHVANFPYLLGVQGLHRRCTGDVSGAVMISARATRSAISLAETGAQSTDEVDALRADALMLRLWQSRYGWQDAESTIADAHLALGCDHGRANSSGHHARINLSPGRMSWLMVELAAAETWLGDLTSASIHLDEALVSARLAGHRHLVTAGLAHRAVIEYSRGDVQSAATSAQSALDHEELEQVSEDYSVRAHVVLGLSAFNRLDFDAAQKWHEQVESCEVSSTDSVVAAMRMLLRACLLVEAGDLDVARRELTTDPAAAGPLPAFLSRDLCLIRYRCAALIADSAAARQQVDVLRSLGFPDDARLLEAVGLISGENDGDAAQTLDAALDETPAAHPILRNAVAGLRVSLLLRAGDEPTARQSMVALMNRVTPQQTLQALTPAASEPAFIDLLSQLTAESDANPFGLVVLDALTSHQSTWREIGRPPALSSLPATPAEAEAAGSAEYHPEGSVSIPAQPSRYAVLDGIPVKLTAREADVLGQLALGSSYTEIAKDLFITENTVKTHLASLYRKLAVDKRSAALRVARSLGLLT